MTEKRELPYDVGVEQALLGALMVDEQHFYELQTGATLSHHHFYDPLHRRLYEGIAKRASRGEMVTPLTMANAFREDAGLQEVGGRKYLVNLVRSAPPMPNIRGYSEILRDLSLRRSLVVLSQDLVEGAYSAPSGAAMADAISEEIYEVAHGGIAGAEPDTLDVAIDKAIAVAERALKEPRRVRISTGLPCVDTALGGLFITDLTVLGAAPSQGKSGLVGQLALAAARQDHPTLVFSKEMSSAEFCMRYIAQETGIPSNRIIEGRVTDPEFGKIMATRERFNNLPYRIDESSNLTVAQIRARAMAAKRKMRGLSLVAVDHLRFVQPADRRQEERDYIQQITRDFKIMGKELECAVLLVSHLNRDFRKRADKRPQESDLYGSSAIEQNADHIWFLHREEVYLQDEAPPASRAQDYANWETLYERSKGKAELFSKKRRGGPVGSAKLRFNGPMVQFNDPAIDSRQLSVDDVLALTGR